MWDRFRQRQILARSGHSQIGALPLQFSMTFEREDNWDDARSYLRGGIVWRVRDANPDCVIYEAEQDAERWAIRLNDFPDEPCFTLMVDGREVIHFNNWPPEWGNRPEL